MDSRWSPSGFTPEAIDRSDAQPAMGSTPPPITQHLFADPVVMSRTNPGELFRGAPDGVSPYSGRWATDANLDGTSALPGEETTPQSGVKFTTGAEALDREGSGGTNHDTQFPHDEESIENKRGFTMRSPAAPIDPAASKTFSSGAASHPASSNGSPSQRVDADHSSRLQLKALEEMLCTGEIQRGRIQQQARSAQQQQLEAESRHRLTVMELQEELDVTRDALATMGAQYSAIKDERAELLDQLGALEKQVADIQLFIGSRTVSAAGGGNTSRDCSPGAELDGSDAEAIDRNGASPRASSPRDARLGLDGAEMALGSANRRERELRLYDVIEKSSRVFTSIQQQTLELQHQLANEQATSAELREQNEKLRGSHNDTSVLQLALTQERASHDELRNTALIESEKLFRSFTMMQSDVIAAETKAALETSLREAAIREREEAVASAKATESFLKQQFDEELERTRESLRKSKDFEVESHRDSLNETASSLRHELQNMTMKNNLLQKNIDEWHSEHDRVLRIKNTEIDGIKADHETSERSLRTELAQLKERVRANDDVVGALREQVQLLKDELATSRREVEKKSVAVADESRTNKDLKAKVKRLESQLAAALPGLSPTPETPKGRERAATIASKDPPFMAKLDSPTNDAQKESKPPEEKKEAVASPDTAAPKETAEQPSPKLREPRVVLPTSVSPRGTSAASPSPGGAAYASDARLIASIKELEQVVVAVEREKAQLLAKHKAEGERARVAAEAHTQEREVAAMKINTLTADLRQAQESLARKQVEIAGLEATQKTLSSDLEAAKKTATAAERDAAAALKGLEQERQRFESRMLDSNSRAQNAITELDLEKDWSKTLERRLQSASDALRKSQQAKLMLEERLARREILHESQLYFVHRENTGGMGGPRRR